MTEGTNRFGRQEDAKNSKALNEYASSKSDPPNKEQRVWFCVEPTLNHTPSLPILLVGSISGKIHCFCRHKSTMDQGCGITRSLSNHFCERESASWGIPEVGFSHSPALSPFRVFMISCTNGALKLKRLCSWRQKAQTQPTIHSI